MSEYFFKEDIFVLLEEVERMVTHSDLFSSSEKFHCSDVDLFEVNEAHSENFLAYVMSFLVNSGYLNDLIRCEES